MSLWMRMIIFFFFFYFVEWFGGHRATQAGIISVVILFRFVTVFSCVKMSRLLCWNIWFSDKKWWHQMMVVDLSPLLGFWAHQNIPRFFFLSPSLLSFDTGFPQGTDLNSERARWDSRSCHQQNKVKNSSSDTHRYGVHREGSDGPSYNVLSIRRVVGRCGSHPLSHGVHHGAETSVCLIFFKK